MKYFIRDFGLTKINGGPEECLELYNYEGLYHPTGVYKHLFCTLKNRIVVNCDSLHWYPGQQVKITEKYLNKTCIQTKWEF